MSAAKPGEFPIAVVIPTYNRGPDIDKLLLRLKDQSCQAFEIKVIDNSSTDNTERIVWSHRSSWGERLHYHRKDPQGPASARNFGIDNSSNDLILFLDSDVYLADDWIERAFAEISRDDAIAAVGGMVIYDFDHSRINAFGGDLGYFGLAWDLCEGEPVSSQELARQRIWINCSAMLARRDRCQAVGGFDETFFYGYEDSDLGWKLNLAGYQLWVYPELKAYHQVLPDPGVSSGLIQFHYCKNRLRSLLINASPLSLIPRLVCYSGYSFIDLILRGPRKPKFDALSWMLANLTPTLTRRKRTQRRRRVADGPIFALGQRRWFPPTPLRGQRRRAVAGVANHDVAKHRVSTQDDRV